MPPRNRPRFDDILPHLLQPAANGGRLVEARVDLADEVADGEQGDLAIQRAHALVRLAIDLAERAHELRDLAPDLALGAAQPPPGWLTAAS